MRTDRAATEFELRAAEALRALLEQVSAVKLKEMKSEPPVRGRAAEILARIDILGHSHTLACELNADTRPSKVRASLKSCRTVPRMLPARPRRFSSRLIYRPRRRRSAKRATQDSSISKAMPACLWARSSSASARCASSLPREPPSERGVSSPSRQILKERMTKTCRKLPGNLTRNTDT